MIRSILRRPQYYAILAILFAAILALCANPLGTISLIATKAASFTLIMLAAKLTGYWVSRGKLPEIAELIKDY